MKTVQDHRCCSRPRSLCQGTQHSYQNSQRSKTGFRAKTIKKHQDRRKELLQLRKIQAANKGDNLPTDQRQRGDAVEDPKEQANILNDFFSSVFTVEDRTSLPDIDHREEDMPAIAIQSEDVMSRLLKLRADKAPGSDCI